MLRIYGLSSYANIVLLGSYKNTLCRGGVIFWADMVGAKYIASKLNQWSKTYNNFFKPCAFLEERAASGVRLVSTLRVLPFDDSIVRAQHCEVFHNKLQGLEGKLHHMISNCNPEVHHLKFQSQLKYKSLRCQLMNLQ